MPRGGEQLEGQPSVHSRAQSCQRLPRGSHATADAGRRAVHATFGSHLAQT